MKIKGAKDIAKKLKLLAVVLLLIYFAKLAFVQSMKISDNNRQISSLNNQINNINHQKRQYNKLKKIINSEAYIEKLARQKYNLLKPGDKVFVLSN